MNATRPRFVSPRRSAGLSISEVLVSLAITASLLTAVAAAFHASGKIVDDNDRFSRAAQSGRVAINQMLTEVRRCDAVNVTPTEIQIIRPDATRPADEKIRHYRYDPATRRLLLYFTRADDSLSPEYPLASEILAAAPFTRDVGKDANNTDCVTRVAINFGVEVGQSSIQVSGAAAPRRSLTYR